jgi:Protein of unknown function (DUF2865)
LVTIPSLDRANTETGPGLNMIKPLRRLGFLALALSALVGPAAAQSLPPVPPAPIPGQSLPVPAAPPPVAAQPVQAPPVSSNPVCARLEGQLAVINRGAGDPRAEQIKRAEDTAAKQQADLDRLLAKSRKQGCEGGGFFALFTGHSPECQPLNVQVQQMRDNLDRTMSDLERLKSGNSDQEGPRRALIGQLAENNCGPQYRAAAQAQGPGGFLDALFGGHLINPGGDGLPSGTYRTVCVRTCDGYYFPISYSTVPNRFPDDARACQRECPATETQLFTYRNPGEDIGQAVSIGGAPYTELPNAFRYRKEFTATCSCRRPGQTWADALKGADDASTLEAGDIVVTDQNAKALSQPPQPKGVKPGKPGAKGQDATAAAGTAPSTDAKAPAADTPKGTVRAVGPPFVAAH